jgi:hypothetical protein
MGCFKTGERLTEWATDDSMGRKCAVAPRDMLSPES